MWRQELYASSVLHYDYIPHSRHGRAYDGKLCHYIHYCGTGLIQLGVPILAAHMFVFYFGIIAILLRLWRWRLMQEALFLAVIR